MLKSGDAIKQAFCLDKESTLSDASITAKLAILTSGNHADKHKDTDVVYDEEEEEDLYDDDDSSSYSDDDDEAEFMTKRKVVKTKRARSSLAQELDATHAKINAGVSLSNVIQCPSCGKVDINLESHACEEQGRVFKAKVSTMSSEAHETALDALAIRGAEESSLPAWMLERTKLMKPGATTVQEFAANVDAMFSGARKQRDEDDDDDDDDEEEEDVDDDKKKAAKKKAQKKKLFDEEKQKKLEQRRRMIAREDEAAAHRRKAASIRKFASQLNSKAAAGVATGDAVAIAPAVAVAESDELKSGCDLLINGKPKTAFQKELWSAVKNKTDLRWSVTQANGVKIAVDGAKLGSAYIVQGGASTGAAVPVANTELLRFVEDGKKLRVVYSDSGIASFQSAGGPARNTAAFITELTDMADVIAKY